MRVSLIMIVLVVLSGCASNVVEPAFEINNQKFTSSMVNNQKLFSYIVSVKPSSSSNLTPTKKMSRSKYKKLLLSESFSDSGELKLELEDKAAQMLEQELKDRRYCSQQHSIDNVLWRDFSVKLSGRCR
ncbi:hypothetical protein [Pseudoalteromonas denitrificans]|uniref:Lipoprotein n=1 Tax=Pseudoalteromonas denitrificans DSM 6059 TaxID=1123010 RepID=A0A1I1JG18_9GAMM|nr:hypothetical protein [Pseudoalteromonas denitrificans]SFC45568.1 hypothetical protein SAMN02745724_01717 [Pseudoalteromonas denitrificans DSM 6059]